jgi:hypothetical protein
MEADWELELGSDAPVIDAAWPGFVDLRIFPKRIAEIEETRQFPALGNVLVRLNAHGSPVWTAKCDVWRVDEPVDPYEMDAEPANAAHAVACYIDLLPRSDQQWNLPEQAASACKSFCERLRAIPLRCCRVDLVVRHALITPQIRDLGITAYLTACGPTEDEAREWLAMALAAFADSLVLAAPPAQAASPLQ